MRAYVSPTNAACRATLRTLLFAGVAPFALVGCSDVVSLAPAITDQDAYEVPDFVGEWRAVDTLTVDSSGNVEVEDGLRRMRIHRLDGPVPNYVIDTWGVEKRDSTKIAVPYGPRSYDARVGRIGPFSVMEIRPAMEVDSLLIAADHAYDPALQATYEMLAIEVDSSTLKLWLFEADSVHEAVTDGRCPGPYYVDPHRQHMVLTGSSEQVRAIWTCVSALPGVLNPDTAILRRAPR